MPFLISAALIGVGLYVRLHIDETPVFAEERTRHAVAKAPLAELLRQQRREVTLATGTIIGCYTYNFIGSAYLATYAHTHLGYSRNVVLCVGVLGGLTSMAFIAFSATLCDRVGRRRMMLVGWTVCLPWSFLMIPLIDTGKPICYAAAVVGVQTATGVGWGPAPTFIPELFRTRYRYSGSALATNLAGVATGAVPPLIAGPLHANYGSWAIGLMLAVFMLVSLTCTYLLPETNGTALQSVRGAF